MRGLRGREPARRWGRTACAILLLALSVATPATAENTASDAPLLYNASATGVGIGLVYDRVGLLALSPILDTGFPRATVGADSTPSAGARGAAADPGLLSAANAVAPVLGVPPGLTPPYPLFADANYPSGPERAEAGIRQDVPLTEAPFLRGVSGQASARLDEASAQARFARVDHEAPSAAAARRIMVAEAGRAGLSGLVRESVAALRGAGLPARPTESSGALVEFAAGESASSVARAGTRLTSKAEGRLLGVSLLGGLFTIREVRGAVDVAWEHPDQKPVVKRTAAVSGAEFLGMPVTFTERGFEFQGNAVPVPVEETLNRFVAERGGAFRVGGFRVSESRADVAALVFDFDGEIQPDVPGLLSSERDIVHLTMGAAGATFFSQLGQAPVEDDFDAGAPGGSLGFGASAEEVSGGFSGADGTSAPEPPGPLDADFTGGDGDGTGLSPGGGSEGLSAGAPAGEMAAGSAGSGQGPGTSSPTGGGPAGPAADSESAEGAALARGAPISSSLNGEIADVEAPGRLPLASAIVALGALACLAVMGAGRLRFLLPDGGGEDAL